MNKEVILYDNSSLYSSEQMESMRQILFDECAAEYDWLLPADVPEKMIEDAIRDDDDIAWQDFTYRLEEILNKGCLLTGYCGRWDGNREGGKFITKKEDFIRCIEHLDEITITDSNGHLIIEGYHHDGKDRYELRVLTKKGYEYATNNYFANSRKLHNTIMQCNFYSRLPRLASV